MALALVHVVGALAVTFAFGLLVLWIGSWEQERVKLRRLQDASIALGVPMASLEKEELVPRLLEYSSARFSGELLRNRFSDLCGLARTAWGWIGSLLQVTIVVAVGWKMYESGLDNAVYMWSVLGVAFFFWVVSVGFSFTCLLLTGRYPGEANVARKAVAGLIEQRSAAQTFSKSLDDALEA